MSDSADGTGGTNPDDNGSDPGPKQVSSPNYHSVNHTAAQTCGWTANALRDEGKCYKNILVILESTIRDPVKEESTNGHGYHRRPRTSVQGGSLPA